MNMPKIKFLEDSELNDAQLITKLRVETLGLHFVGPMIVVGGREDQPLVCSIKNSYSLKSSDWILTEDGSLIPARWGERDTYLPYNARKEDNDDP
jgi:hypothetical protein